MTAIEHEFPTADIHPIDMVETLAEQSRWDFDRVGEDQIAMAVEGAWQTYSLTLAWTGHDDMLRLVCTFELKAPEERKEVILALLNLVNDKVWSGSFVYWPEHAMVAFRYGLTLAGGAIPTNEQLEMVVWTAVALSERFYPAFQLAAFGKETAEEAAEIAIEEAYGTA